MAHHVIQPGRQNSSNSDDATYDLYAVCNHYGNMNGGHYTAFCKNPIDCTWHEFDDTRVKAVSESQVMTKAAYLLFYQRRALTKQTNQRMHLGNHWVFHMFSNNNNSSPVRCGSQSCPTTPTTPKSVHFDTSTPLQIPREASNGSRSRSESVGSNQMPSKSILRPLTPQNVNRNSAISYEEKSPEQTATSRWQEHNVKTVVRNNSLLVHKNSGAPAPSSKMGACVDVPQKNVEESNLNRGKPTDGVKSSPVDNHNDWNFVDKQSHFSMPSPTAEHDVFNPLPLADPWPVLGTESTFSKSSVQHPPQTDRLLSFEDSVMQSMGVKNHHPLKVENKHDKYHSLQDGSTRTAESRNQRPLIVEDKHDQHNSFEDSVTRTVEIRNQRPLKVEDRRDQHNSFDDAGTRTAEARNQRPLKVEDKHDQYHSLQDSGTRTVNVRSQRPLKIEDKHNQHNSFEDGGTRTLEIRNQHSRNIEVNGYSDVVEAQSVGVRDRINHFERNEDSRSSKSVSRRSEDFKEKRADNKETMTIKKSMVSLTNKSANVPVPVKNPVIEHSAKNVPEVQRDLKPPVPVNGYRKISEGTREKYATIARIQNAQIDELMNASEQTVTRSKTDDNISAKILETSRRLTQPKASNTTQNYPKCHPKYVRNKNNNVDQRDTVSLHSMGHRSRNRPQSDNISVKSFGYGSYNGYARRDSSASRGDIRYRPHMHKGNYLAQMKRRQSVEYPAPYLKESSV